MRSSRHLLVCLMLVLLPTMTWAEPHKKKIVMLIGAGDSLVVARAFKELKTLPGIGNRYSFEFYTDREMRNKTVKGDHIKDASIIMADFMHGEVEGFLVENLPVRGDGKKPKIYSLRCANLAHKLKKQGISLNRQSEAYYSPPTRENVKNLILLALSEEGENVHYERPFTLPKSGIFHPDATEVFPDFASYLKWYRKSGKYSPEGFWVGIYTFHVSALKDRGKIEAHMIHALEKEGINVLPAYGRPPYHESLQKYFLDEKDVPRVQILCGFSLRFLKGFPRRDRTDPSAEINAPVFIPLTAHSVITIDQWRKVRQGDFTHSGWHGRYACPNKTAAWNPQWWVENRPQG